MEFCRTSVFCVPPVWGSAVNWSTNCAYKGVLLLPCVPLLCWFWYLWYIEWQVFQLSVSVTVPGVSTFKVITDTCMLCMTLVSRLSHAHKENCFSMTEHSCTFAFKQQSAQYRMFAQFQQQSTPVCLLFNSRAPPICLFFNNRALSYVCFSFFNNRALPYTLKIPA